MTRTKLAIPTTILARDRKCDLHQRVDCITTLFQLDFWPQPAPALDRTETFKRHLRHDKILCENVHHGDHNAAYGDQ